MNPELMNPGFPATLGLAALPAWRDGLGTSISLVLRPASGLVSAWCC